MSSATDLRGVVGVPRGLHRTCRLLLLVLLSCGANTLVRADCDCTKLPCIVTVQDAGTLTQAISKSCLSIKLIEHIDLGNQTITFPTNLGAMMIWGECSANNRPSTEAFLNAASQISSLGVDGKFPCTVHSAANSADMFTFNSVQFLYMSNLVLVSTPSDPSQSAHGINLINGELWMVNTIMGGFKLSSILAMNSNVYLTKTASYQVGSLDPAAPSSGINFISTQSNAFKLVMSDTTFRADVLASYTPVYIGADPVVPTTGYRPTSSALSASFQQAPIVVVTSPSKQFFVQAKASAAGAVCLGLCIGYTASSPPRLYLDATQLAAPPISPPASLIAGGAAPLQDFATLTWAMVNTNTNNQNWLQSVSRLGVPGSSLTADPPSTIGAAAATSSGSSSSWKTWYTVVIAVGAAVLLIAAVCIALYVRRRRRAEREAATAAKEAELRKNAAPAAYPPVPWSDGSQFSSHSRVYVPSGPYDTGPYDSRVNAHLLHSNGLASDHHGSARPSRMLAPYEKSYESSHSGGGGGGFAPGGIRPSRFAPVVDTDSMGRSTYTDDTAARAGPGDTYRAQMTANMPNGQRNYQAELDLLEAQLDAVDREQQGIFLKRYQLLGREERRSGGQGLVQFADMIYNTKRKVAIKFFLSRTAFDIEQMHYKNAALHRVLPPVDDVVGNEDGALRDPYGRPFPPLVVVEKGESLDEWSRRMQQADFASRMHIIIHLVERVKMLHDVGMVHRDLKPSNTIYLQSRNEWSLIDFGSAARIGESRPLSMSISYAAPEIVNAFQRCEEDETFPRTVVVSPSTDVWSLGVMAFELLTHTRVWTSRHSAGDVKAAMRVEDPNPLPWEPSAPNAAQYGRKLGFMGSEIMRMLHRDPAQRATLRSVYGTWRHMLQQETSTLVNATQESSESEGGQFRTTTVDSSNAAGTAPVPPAGQPTGVAYPLAPPLTAPHAAGEGAAPTSFSTGNF